MYFLIAFTCICLLVPIYVYIGYPLILWFLLLIIKERKIDKAAITPRVTMIVSCFNESSIIREKISNCRAIDYPEAMLDFIFVSDGSSDGTDDLIENSVDEQIRLIRQEQRLGKTMGLNQAVLQAEGEIIVFSDANAMYRKDAVRMLVRNFNDEAVGYAVGAAIYRDTESSSAGTSENLYWKYEIFLKRMESRLHSVVGGDGAIYAIRKHLYEKLDPEDINDFVNPLQIISRGFRGVFEEAAICYEETAGDFDKEGRRKQRIVNRSFSGLLKTQSLLNPFRFGFFSFEIFSHKLLRWLIPFFLLGACISIAALAFLGVREFQLILLLLILAVWMVMLGYGLRRYSGVPAFLMLPYYFFVVNLNSMLGILRALKGEVQVKWDTHRHQDESVMTANWMLPVFLSASVVVSVIIFILVLRSVL